MTILERGIEWVRGVGREFKTSEFAVGIGVSSTQASRTLTMLERDAHVRRLRFGCYAPSRLTVQEDTRSPAASPSPVTATSALPPEVGPVDFNELARDVQSEEAEVARLQGELWQAEARRAMAVQRLERALLTRRPTSISRQNRSETTASADLCSTVPD